MNRLRLKWKEEILILHKVGILNRFQWRISKLIQINYSEIGLKQVSLKELRSRRRSRVSRKYKIQVLVMLKGRQEIIMMLIWRKLVKHYYFQKKQILTKAYHEDHMSMISLSLLWKLIRVDHKQAITLDRNKDYLYKAFILRQWDLM